MASVHKVGNSWRAQVRKRGVSMSMTFDDKEDAIEWGRQQDKSIAEWVKKNPTFDGGQIVYRPLKKTVSQPPEICFDGLLSEDEIASKATRLDPVCGVYFLVSSGKVVYVGSSVNTHARISAHRRSSHKTFDSVLILEMSESIIRDVESKYILMLKPPLNFSSAGHLVIPVATNRIAA